MRWDDVLTAIRAALVADSVVAALYGNSVRLAGDSDYKTPGIELRLLIDSIDETWEPCTVQVDQWAETAPELVAGERAIRKLLDHESPTTIEGVYMWATFLEGADLGAVAMGPDRGNVFGRAMRFRMMPVREDQRAGRSA